MSDNFVYLNGHVVPAAEAVVSVFDTGFLHGASVFTTLLGHNGRPFRLDRHLKRLQANAGKVGLAHTATTEELTQAVDEVLKANSLTEARIRITLSPGPVGGEPAPTTVVTAVEARNEPRWYSKGISVIINQVRQYEHDPIVGLKTGCYLTRVLARQAAAAMGADEALWFTHSGLLAEASYCNVFLVREGTVYTPPLSTPVLAGIVREAVLELCGKLQIPCRDDRELTAEDVQQADEIFLTSSVAGVRPVVRVARRPVGDEKPGAVTTKIMSAYTKLLDEECPKTAR
jgi:branched-chain amino acid aminotransferase